MNRNLALAYGVVAYALFFAAFLYLIGFVGDLGVEKSIDAGGAWSPLGEAMLVNLLLIALFGIQHSVMARPRFKRWWTRMIPEPIERSTYLVCTVAVLCILYWQWQPIYDTVWNLEGTVFGPILRALFFAGFGMVLISTFLIDHFELFGLRQVFLHWRGQPYATARFREISFYRFVRHPLMLGFLIAFWAAPHMTVGHLVFALAFSLYILIALQIEERDLTQFHPEEYADYRRRVPMLVPFFRGREREDTRADAGTGAPE